MEAAVTATGELELADGVAADVDVVMARCHPRHGPMDLERDVGTRRLVGLVERGQVHVLTHVLGRRLLQKDAADIDMHAVLLACARRGVVVEVSGEGDRLDLDARSCRLAGEVGCRLAITARAAQVEALPRRALALMQARRGWVQPSQVINADPQPPRWRGGLPSTTTSAETASASPDVKASRSSGAAGTAGTAGAAGAPRAPRAPRKKASSPLAKALTARPLAPATRDRLEALLRGDDDDELTTLLEVETGNALQRAFELLVAGGVDAPDPDPEG